nr:hypothetical protein [uncultured Prevotella sp.]
MVSSDTPIYNKILRYFALEYEEIVKHRTHFCSNLRFEKGIKDIQTSVPDQKVTIQYDADKKK